ncbi:TPA: hypothetical protein N0F65_006602 [Lagenidium giganteum]|uniref:Uncharacterized protein n=1 Tax=Lagenidium giganteum TaxID=4803 RepID=A0AAV2Z7W7_9STRA|nr:TPA: hypothetical protein N0F65_006602 [Lagenidium giganteum]
MTCTRTTSRG